MPGTALGPPALRRVGLALILVLAAGLRFTGLSWGLRHPPHVDEQVFVDHASSMLEAGGLDHRFYEYPGFFFFLLVAAFRLLHPSGTGAEAYLVARAVVASFSLASVALVYLLGSRMLGPRAGLAAAALMAVSPAEVRTAHWIRPDAVLESFVLLAALVFLRIGADRRWDVLSGVALGTAAAVKFSGILLFPSYLVQRILAPGHRWRQGLLALVTSVAAFGLLSPYSFLHLGDALQGAWTQLAWHYPPPGEPRTGYRAGLAHYGSVLLTALGSPALVLALLGVYLLRREWRRWAFLAALPVTMLLVFSSAEVRRVRFLLPSLGFLTVFAGGAVEAIAARSAPAAAATLLLASAAPLTRSVRYAASLSRPRPSDLALDWIEAHLPPGSRILTTWPARLGLDPRRYEVLHVDRLDESTWRLALHVDVVAAGPSDDRSLLRRLRTLHRIRARRSETAWRIELLAAPEELRPRYEPLPLAAARLTASENPDLLEQIRDGSPLTSWRAAGSPREPPWLQVDFPQPRLVGRLELHLGAQAQPFSPELAVWLAREGGGWDRVPVMPGRPPASRQVGDPLSRSQVLLLEPMPSTGVRILPLGLGGSPWQVAELRIDAVSEATR